MRYFTENFFDARRFLVTWFVAAALFWICSAAPAQTLNLETNNLVMNSVALCPYGRTFDGQWLGVTVASDGCCYFGSSTHDYKHGAGFFRYNPQSVEVTMLAEDLTAVCGEDVRFTPPQGKLHSDIVEFNGWLYFSTHLGNYWIEAESAYTGGHVLGYELASGHFRDFGVIRSNYTCYSAVGVDPVRGKLLSFVTRTWGSPQDSRIYRIDLATGVKQEVGIVPGYTCFYFFVDSRGDCWFSCEADNGSLRVVRSATGRMETFANVLPESSLGSTRWWDWAKAVPGSNRCVFKLFNGNYLYFFDPDVFQTNHTAAFVPIRNIGPAPSGVALGSNRVYYVQRDNRQVGNQGYQDFHLMSVPIFTNTPIVDHGLIMDQSGRLVWRLPGLAADGQDHLFGVGDWWLLPGEQGTIVGTLRHEDVYGSTNYQALPRGEFFARIDLSQSPTLHEKRTLLATTAGGGSIALDSTTNVFSGNAVVRLSAVSSTEWKFLGWSGDADGTNTTNTLVVTRDKSVQGVFGATITTSVTGNGAISLYPSGGTYPFGTVLRVTAQPQAGNYFSGWGLGASGDTNPLVYVVTNGNANIRASFAALPTGKVAFTPLVEGSGSVSVVPRANSYNIGQTVTLTATPEDGQSFVGWSGAVSGISNPISLAVNTSTNVTATFSRRPRFDTGLISSTGFVTISFAGDAGRRYRIDSSTDLTNWISLGTITNKFGSFTFTDPGAADLSHRFYRAMETGGN